MTPRKPTKEERINLAKYRELESHVEVYRHMIWDMNQLVTNAIEYEKWMQREPGITAEVYLGNAVYFGDAEDNVPRKPTREERIALAKYRELRSRLKEYHTEAEGMFNDPATGVRNAIEYEEWEECQPILDDNCSVGPE